MPVGSYKIWTADKAGTQLDWPPKDATARTVTFVQSCAKGDSGAFANPGAGPTPASTAAGAAILLLLDPDHWADRKATLKLLSEGKAGEEGSDLVNSGYSAVLATMLSGEPTWSTAWKPMRDAILSKQAEDGSWFPPRAPSVGLGTISSTAAAVITLAMPYRLLPLYGK